tara:strand:- start:29442 stop:29726 length:285 start_codon:yes stop_codon:yes gene_type:complete
VGVKLIKLHLKLETMLRIMNPLNVIVSAENYIPVDYANTGETPIFDICDNDGNLLESGVLDSYETNIYIECLEIGQYYIFVLDEPHMISQKFAV